MSYDYDKLYRESQHALGDTSAPVVKFFKTLTMPNARVLDIGCGQGRDALFIARLGHAVVGVDLSPAGVADMQAEADDDGLPVTGIVADITSYAPGGMFDVILIDRTLHMLDAAPRHAVLNRLLGHVASDGYLLILDERTNMSGFRDVIAAHATTWATLTERAGHLFLQRTA